MSKVKDSRAIGDSFLKKFKPGGVMYQFTKLVLDRPELCLNFRGNNGDNEAVNIYYNNKTVFKLYLDGTVEISFNHARYKRDWKMDLCRLEQFGFRIPKLTDDKLKKSGVGYVKAKVNDLDNDAAVRIYDEIIKPIMESYFSESDGKRYDYFKESSAPNRFEKEKVKQHEIFLSMKNYLNGYFFYDTEFHQVFESNDEKKNDADSHNNPDMTAIRFANGKPVAFVLVEVKSTKTAMFGTSGVLEHIRNMESYSNSKIQSRLLEAYEMMEQYNELHLYDIPNLCEEEFQKISYFENILIFTDDAKLIWENPSDVLTNKKHIAEIEEARKLTELVEDGIILGDGTVCSIYQRKRE